MKKLYRVTLVTILICINSHAKAQYFDWVKSYTSCASNPANDIGHAVSDADGNVYFLGRFHKGAVLEGEELLPVDASREDVSACIVKYSPDG